MNERWQSLVDSLRGLDGAVVALSGGVDSSLLLLAAREALGDRVLAVTAVSPLFPDRETAGAASLARDLGVEHRALALPLGGAVAENGPRRCYHCKHAMLSRLVEIAGREGLGAVLEGSNLDDLSEHRPGARAIRELGVVSPLTGIDKATIRSLAHERRLPVWDRPSTACLASRIPYGTPLTAERLARVERAEQAIRDLGFTQLRVRDHDPLARVELLPGEMERLDEETRARLVHALRESGWTWVCVDLEGYRTGALDEGLEP